MIFSSCSFLFGQFSGSNQANFQIGNIPGNKPSDRSNLYNQLNLRYNYNNFSFGLRAENFLTESGDEYNRISKKYVRYSSDGLIIRVGNFYENLGKGLVLRTYEIPSAVFEETGSRQRYGFYKDIEGLSVRFTSNYAELKMLYGRTFDINNPPKISRSKRLEDLVMGAELNIYASDMFVPGIIYLRNHNNISFEKNQYAGFNLDGNINDDFQMYAEYVQNTSPENNFLEFGKKSAHAFYSSASYNFDPVSLILEYKDYNDFNPKFNDPPPLVREQSYTLLNRSTHTINPENESGYQVEVLINLFDFNTVTLNHSRATNDRFGFKYEFREYYADLNWYFENQLQGKIFIDYSEDGIESEKDRYTGGVSLETQLYNLWSGVVEFQYQNLMKDFQFNPSANHEVQNFYFNFSVSQTPTFSFSASLEMSDDRVETNRNVNGKNDIFVSWPSFDISYLFNQNNTFSLFYGKRRGGTACTGGICYQVQKFNGLELRLNSRF